MNLVKTAMLIAFMTALFMGVGYLIGGSTGMVIALVIAMAMNVFSWWNSDKMVLRMHNAMAIDRSSAPEYYGLVEALSERAGLPMPKVYLIKTDQPNAFATGRSPNNAAVAVTTGLLERLTREEAAGVIAHELAHIQNRDTLTMTVTATLAGAIAALEPDLVVNAAAYTAVDKAESEPQKAMTVNGEAAGAVAAGARKAGAPVIQISTDYVFDGALDRPWREDDAVAPLGAYGRSKLAGEEAVAAANPHHVVLRTAWVYSPFGGNFVKTMLRLAETHDELDVVADQTGNPTSAFVVADAVLSVAGRLSVAPADDVFGTYHVAAAGTASWCDFARAIFEIAGPDLPRVPKVNAITTAQYPTPARRPANSRLDTARFERTFGYHPPQWRVSLEETLARIL